ncbi:MAG: hypothetical protein ABGW95_05020, partial [Candidatus Poseidoniia archaeon]
TLANGLRLLKVDVAEAAEVSIAPALPVGWQHDPKGRTGCAEVMRWLLTVAQKDVPESQRLKVAVRPRMTLLWHSGPRRDAVDRLAFVEKVLAGRIDVTPDDLAVALGRARLESDDHSWLFPGSVIRQKAWREVWRGQPGGRQSLGIASEIASLDAVALQNRLRQHYGCTEAALVVIGNPAAKEWQAFRTKLEKLLRTAGAPPLVIHDTAPTLEAEAPHDRIDGPFVTAAWHTLSPTAADYLPFVVGMLALRTEASREFGGYRGMEWRALFPFVSFEYWKDDSLVRVNRRGLNGSTVADTRAEIEQFLRRIRRAGLRRGALDAARIEVANTVAVPPYASAAGPYLSVRARYVATALCLEWPMDAAERVGKVELAEVNRVLREHLAPDRVHWFALRPAKAGV